MSSSLELVQTLPPNIMHSPMITLTLSNNKMSKIENGSFSIFGPPTKPRASRVLSSSLEPMQVLPLNMLPSSTTALSLTNGRMPEIKNG